jgi:dihydroorotate dehydrogenase (NAD+) catalytic subunit
VEVNLEVNLAGLKLKNPIILASGIMGSSGSLLKKVANAGVGAVVTKTLTAEPRKGYDPPIIYSTRCYTLNAVGLANPGIKNFKNDIQEAKECGIPVIISLAGSSPEEFAWMSGLAQDYGADAVELNLSCPHVKGLGTELGDDPIMVEEVVRSVKKNVKIPVFSKLTPNTSDILIQGRASIKGGADGLVAVNTLRGMIIDVELKAPVLSNIYGGISGKALHPIAVYSVYKLSSNFNVPIIGVGGVESWKDVIEFILAGAVAVQIGTILISKEPEIIVPRLIKGVIKYMKRHGFTDIKNMSGLIIKKSS